jgi:outer membrane protein assembly factor BamA
VELGEVRFAGQRHTRESFLHRRVRLGGPLLDRVEVDRSRERLARLGSFKFVGVRLEPEGGSPRDVVFELTEGKRYELNLIAGYGSYDQLFGGAEFQHFNLWNIGHNARVRAVQSFKSTQGTLVYSVPEVLAPGLNLYAAADGFQREELTFDRQEVKLSLGLRKQFPRSGNQAGLRYSYEFLDAQTAAVGDQATRAAAVIADWQMDRRDNPLLPRRGTRLFANLEFAQPALGGDADYTQLEFGVSHHHPFRGGLILHASLQQSVVSSPDRASSLPFNKRFFPGGENSVRGYQRGGASPLDANGDQLGAESALQWNVELEQQLVRAFSVVAFVDGVGVTPVIENFPFDEALWSAGLGLRWNTIIGPVRLEYGHNLTPREQDPAGTLHFSIGYPF